MKSAIRRIAALAAATTTTAVSVFAAVTPAIAVQFGQQEVNQDQFIAVAAPNRAGTSHQLLILEQVSNSRPCWNEAGNAPTQVDPLLVNFDFSGICGRSTDSNGYSIRVNGQDLGLQYRLRVVQRDSDMLLIGSPVERGSGASEFLIGRTHGLSTNFTKIDLEDGWRFTKRTFENRPLGHVYLTYEGTVPTTPGTGTPGTGTPGTGTPGTGTPGTGTPGAGTPGTGTPGTPPATVSFRDTANDIYLSEIEQAVRLGFVAGFYEDNTFRPTQSLTREQLVSMVIEALNRLPNANLSIPTQASGNPYPDVSAARWSAAKIQFARTNGLISGYEDGSFRPSQPVTRAELVAVLRRAAQFGQQVEGRGTTLAPQQEARTFVDTNTHWAYQTIAEMSSYCGVASPLNESGDAFAPNASAQRNYAAAATLRMLNCAAGTPVITTTSAR